MGDEADPAQVSDVERLRQPIRLEPLEGQPDFPPLRRSNKTSPIGLPRAKAVRRPQMHAIAFAVAARDQ